MMEHHQGEKVVGRTAEVRIQNHLDGLALLDDLLLNNGLSLTTRQKHGCTSDANDKKVFLHNLSFYFRITHIT